MDIQWNDFHGNFSVKFRGTVEYKTGTSKMQDRGIIYLFRKFRQKSTHSC